MTFAQWIVNLASIYVALGFVFAIGFVSVGVNRIDPAAKGSPLAFRLLIFPGVVAFWPLLLKRWLFGHPPPVEKNPHRQSARTSGQEARQ